MSRVSSGLCPFTRRKWRISVSAYNSPHHSTHTSSSFSSEFTTNSIILLISRALLHKGQTNYMEGIANVYLHGINGRLAFGEIVLQQHLGNQLLLFASAYLAALGLLCQFALTQHLLLRHSIRKKHRNQFRTSRLDDLQQNGKIVHSHLATLELKPGGRAGIARILRPLFDRWELRYGKWERVRELSSFPFSASPALPESVWA